jgi:hypothetical protein
MFILKFFASIFLVFFLLGILVMVIGFLIARNFISDFNNAVKNKFEQPEPTRDDFSEESSSTNDIPSMIECDICGTFYAKMPENNLCSCGAKLHN